MTRDYSNLFPSNTAGGTDARQLTPLEQLGWQPFFAQQISVEDMQNTPPVRVVEVHRTTMHVMGEGIDDTLPMAQDATVGDWLLLDRNAPQESRLLDRKSLMKRRAAGIERKLQLIAANVETGFIVSSCNADFNLARLERYIALVFDAEITPVIVLTKTDLAEDVQGYIDVAKSISDLVEVVALDARTDAPKTRLAEWCKPGKTVAFLGSSGVGKSTLTNALSGGNAIETQAIREGDAKGRHTTTSRQLHKMPDGCLVLDTPGMRELQMTDAAAGIGDVFADLQALTAECRFNDCRHDSEPGCAVLAAVERGEVESQRLQRWRKLVAEDAFNSASLSERRSKDKAFGKMVRKAVKLKKKKGR